jgi:hypothetical protein
MIVPKAKRTMIPYIELWEAKQARPDLSGGTYMTALGPAIPYLAGNGVQIVS